MKKNHLSVFTRLTIFLFLGGVSGEMLFSCSDYEDNRLKEMEPSTITFTRATGSIQGCAFTGTITDIVDCYLTLTGFDGKITEVLIDTVSTGSYASPVFETTTAGCQFLTKLTLRRNNNPITQHSYDYAYKPGKLTGVCYVHKATGVDSTYTLTCGNTEKSGVVNGDTIDNVLQPMTEEQVKAWMRTIYNGGTRAEFNCILNEMGWPIVFTRNDFEVVYDFE